jgi:hypothetical protein
VIVSPAGELLVANRQEAADEASLGQPFVDPKVSDESQQLIGRALGGEPEVLGLSDGTILAVALSEGDRVLGVLYVRGYSDSLTSVRSWGFGLAILAGSLLVLTVAAGLIGTVFGRVTSRGIVRRLERLDSATPVLMPTPMRIASSQRARRQCPAFCTKNRLTRQLCPTTSAHPALRTIGSPATRKYTFSAAAANAWFALPSRSRYARPSG